MPELPVQFEDRAIRRVYDEPTETWWFSVVDIVQVLTQQSDPTTARKYWNKLKQRLRIEGSQLVTDCHQLKLTAEDGKQRLTDVATAETLLRLVQSIPSPKAEPFKRWLARVGYERIQEIEDPELATKRTRAIYQAKGYSADWIEKRMRSIAIRDELTDEWKKRGVKEQREYAILTAEISKAAFGLTPTEYAEFKRLKRENLRDHMTDLELIFSMLGEAATTEIARNRDTQGLPQNQQAAHDGGSVAGNARRELEKKSGRKVVTSENYLALAQSAKKAKYIKNEK